MTFRNKIEQLLVIALLAAYFGSVAYSFFEQQRNMGIGMSIGGALFLILIIRRIVRREKKTALLLGVLAFAIGLAGAVSAIVTTVPHDAPESLMFPATKSGVFVFACCSFDLWVDWGKPDNSAEATSGQRQTTSPISSAGAPKR